MSTADLETLLDDSAQQPEPEVTQPVETAPAPQGDKPTASAPPAVAPVEPPDPAHVPREALLDERRKRQDLEKRVADFERHMQEQQRQREQQQPPPPRPDWMSDPEAAAHHMRAEIERNNFETRVHMSEHMIAAKYPDYAEMRDVFAEAAARNRGLAEQLVKHPFPAEFAYTMGKRIAIHNEIGEDPAGYKDRLRSEWEAEFKAKYGIQDGQPAAQAQSRSSAPVPKSLAKAPSTSPARAPNGQFTSGPTPLEDIIG